LHAGTIDDRRRITRRVRDADITADGAVVRE
jgi:hypothetical protein